MKSGIKIVYNKLLGGWYVVRGPHHFPIGGKYASKAEATRKGGQMTIYEALRIRLGREPTNTELKADIERTG